MRISLLFAAGLAVSAAWLLVLFGAVGGHFAFPLDDGYIHLQYARELALGHPFRYDARDPATTGATSTLWPALIAPGFLGGSIAAALAWTSALAAGLVAGTGALLAWAALGLGASARLAALTGLAAVLNGWFLATSLSGMESGLIAFGVALALAAVVHERLGLLALALAVVALTRPEGAIAVVLFAAAALVLGGERRRRLALATVPGALAVVFQAAVWTAATGRPTTDTAVAKSVVYEPGLALGLKGAEWLQALGAAAGQFVRGAVPAAHHPAVGAFLVVPYVAALLAVAGAVLAWRLGLRLFVATAVSVAAAYLVVAASADWSAHNFRYLTALLPVMVVLAVPALDALDRLALPLGTWLAASVVALTALGMPLWQERMVQRSAELNGQHVWLGGWLARNLEPGSRIGFSDAGALKLYSGLPHFDWVGLTTRDEAEAFRAGWGAIFERLESTAPAERPDYLLFWPNVYPELVGSPWVDRQVYASPDLGPSASLGGPAIGVFATDWSSLRLSRVPPPPRPEASWDADVADLRSEAASGYAWHGADPLRAPGTELASATREDGDLRLSEGCREVLGESFDAPSGGTLVARFRRPAEVRVELDGEAVGTLAATGPEDRFAGGAVELPRGGRVSVTAAGGEAYASCHYWLVRSG